MTIGFFSKIQQQKKVPQTFYELWLFLVEGHGRWEELENPEGALFKRIAEKLKIPITNPLPANTMSLEVIQEAAQRYGREKTQYIAVFVLVALETAVRDHTFYTDQIPPLLSRVIKKVSTIYSVPEANLKRDLYVWVGKKESESEIDFWTRYFSDGITSERIDENSLPLLKELIAVSIDLNQETVKHTLRAHPEKSRAFFKVGGELVDLVRTIYGSEP